MTFRLPRDGGAAGLEHFDLTIPAGSSLAIVGQNGAGKTTIAKLLCRLYDPQSGGIEIDGKTFANSIWSPGVRALRRCSRISSAWSCRCATMWRPSGAPDDVLERARGRGRNESGALDTVLAKGYEGGTDLSGGQWQRVALARALAAVKLGAGVVLLDEPTAQLDVRG